MLPKLLFLPILIYLIGPSPTLTFTNNLIKVTYQMLNYQKPYVPKICF